MLTKYVPTLLLVATFAVLYPSESAAADDPFNYLIGRGIADVTGPAADMPMWGFVREGQNTAGIHIRQWSRAFIIAEPDNGNRIVFVSADIGAAFHEIQRSVVAKLGAKYGDVYGLQNVIVSATHTHSGAGGYGHYGADSFIGIGFFEEHFDAIVNGIVDSIVQAHEDLEPGAVYIDTGEVEGAGANRSMPAYLNNPKEERDRYGSDTDKQMTQLKFVDASGDVGVLNWFAVHPTSMTFNNRLISGDHKGHASYLFEKKMNGDTSSGFVAAFAQSNCGDVTANLNLDNTGPGADEFETTQIIAERQFEVARKLFESATEQLKGPIDYRYDFVDFKWHDVDGKFTGSGPQRTCPSSYGYSFAAGSTEDGGGHPSFHEGMTKRLPFVDDVTGKQVGFPSDECRACQEPKAILFATGETEPHPASAQTVPISVVRIGQMALVVVPAEFTTMAGRRARNTVADALGDSVSHVVLAGYANDYAGYVTTQEEYLTQQYEGGHTLYGPWTLAGYQQELHRLASALAAGRAVPLGSPPRDLSAELKEHTLATPFDATNGRSDFGQPSANPKKSYAVGGQVSATFWSGNPRNGFRTGGTFLQIQRETTSGWEVVATDNDWSTKFHWAADEKIEGASHATITWDIPSSTAPGVYRVAHLGRAKNRDGAIKEYVGYSRSFKVKSR